MTSSSGSNSTRGAAAALVLPDPYHDIIKIILNVGNSLSVHLCDNQEGFNCCSVILKDILMVILLCWACLKEPHNLSSGTG